MIFASGGYGYMNEMEEIDVFAQEDMFGQWWWMKKYIVSLLVKQVFYDDYRYYFGLKRAPGFGDIRVGSGESYE